MHTPHITDSETEPDPTEISIQRTFQEMDILQPMTSLKYPDIVYLLNIVKL